MCKQVQPRILFLLLVLGAPLAVCAQSHERFSVVPGDESGQGALGSWLIDFEFTADVTEAKCYELDFGEKPKSDENNVIRVTPRGSDGVLRSHKYKKPGTYWAVMKAWRLPEGDADREVDCEADLGGLAGPIELTLRIEVLPSGPLTPPPPSVERFSATASDPTIDDEVTWADFTFTAYVTGATSYDLNFGDGDAESGIRPRPAGEAVLRHHHYKKPGVYTAVLTARRSSGKSIELKQQVVVEAPAPVVSEQWPKVRPVATVPPEPAKLDLLPWFLLSAVMIATALSRGWRLTRTDPVTFEATRDRGQVEVTDSTAASDAVSMRVRSEPLKFVISVDKGERQ